MRKNVRIKHQQKGIVLIISIIMLVAITALVMAGITLNSAQFLVINNVTEQKRAESAAKEAIERVLNQQTVFNESINGVAQGSSAVACVNSACNINGFNVRVNMPYCYGAKLAAGYSALSNVSPEETHWELVAVAEDPNTGTTATVVEGIRIRLGAGNCGEVFTVN